MLLDTNVVLWLYEDDARLGPGARDRITSAPVAYLSSVVVTEIAVKHMLGRLDLPGGPTFPAPLRSMGLVDLAMSADHSAELLSSPQLARHDPFDRFLLAQAKAERIPLMTSDRTLLALGQDWIINARR